MIIYGWKAKQLAKEPITEKCPHCGSQNTIDMFVIQKYAHIFWIPSFPLQKTGVSQCNHCNQTLELSKMPTYLQAAFHRARATAKTPLWMFTGLAAIVVLIGMAVIDSNKDKEKNAQFVLTPKTGDIYEVKTPNSHYTLMKVIEVQKDSVYVRYNNYESTKATGIYKLKDKAYSEEVYALKKTELKNMFDKGDIFDIERN
jgi:hypothetical protein